ncbi:MAG: acetyltransferase [Opitutales bacterium]|nr:acetyltransferase [Opitutales bacterium]
MKNIVIVGAGGFGREVFNYACDCVRAGADWQVKGFIDDNPDALNGYDYPKKIIGSVKEYAPAEGDFFLCAVGTPKAKKSVVETLKGRGAKFEKLVHPTAYVGVNVKLGEGVVVCPQAKLICDVSLGDFAMVNCASACGHDSDIGAYAVINSFCDITGFCKVGEGAFFASRVSMRPGSKVGNWASVGIGSCVIMNIKDGVSAFGNPAAALK